MKVNFREVARNAALKGWLDWDDTTYTAQNTENRELFFSWVSREPNEDDEDDDGQVSFGEKYLEPALWKRDDIRLLGKIISDDKALFQLKLTRDINAAYRSSDFVFQERQESSIKTLESEVSTLALMAIHGDNLPILEDVLGRFQTIVEKTKAAGFTSVLSPTKIERDSPRITRLPRQ